MCLALLATPIAAQPVFQDRASAFPVQHDYVGGWEHFVGGGAAVFDCNADDKPDVFVAGGSAPARLFLNETTGPKQPVTFALGTIPELTGVTGAYPLDIDSDGHLDLAVMRVGPNLLLKGDGACGFTDASAAWGFQSSDRWSTAFSAIWQPGADWPVLAIGNYVDRGDPDGPFEACDVNHLYQPDGTGYAAPTPLAPGYCALSMLISDWQRTGTPQLRISNDRHYYVRGGYEEMWSLSPLRALDKTDGWDRVSLWGMGIASGDVTGNGFPDVMLTSMGDQVLMFNSGAVWEAAPFDTGATAHRPHTGDDGRPSTGWHAQFGDMDNDGYPDLFVAKGNVDQMPGMAMQDPNNLLMGSEQGTFTEVAAEAGVASDHRSRGAALADFDGDGLLDILVVNRRAPLELWQNVSVDTGAWLQVTLRAPAPNTHAVGAWVEVAANGRVHAQELTVGGGHVSGQATPLHFGLGRATQAQMRVQWPSGDWTPWQDVDANQRITIRP